MKQNLQMIRIKNIKKIIKNNFDGNQTAFAKAINKSPAQVNQWINGYRNLGRGVAFEIEQILKLEIGFLDLDEERNCDFLINNHTHKLQMKSYILPISDEKIQQQAFEIIKQYGMTPEQVLNLILHEIAATKKIPLHFDYLHSQSE